MFGKQVAINRQQFSCRLLKVGTKEGVQNEWDDALNVVGEDDSLWNWGNAFCWGQDAPDEYEPYRAHRGYDSARYWDYLPSVTRTSRLGFRPALVPLPSDHLSPGIEVCAKVIAKENEIGYSSFRQRQLLSVS